jgi:DNA-binding transcriptional LysR family regulator
MIDPRRLLTFREVARCGSFSRAAEALALSQPAVSQQVAALERQLGSTLLVRGRTGAVPTEAGALLLAHADALAAGLELAGVQLGELAAGERRMVRVGAVPSALATVVPAAVAALRADEPALDVALEEGRVDELALAVRTGQLHAAVCFQDAALPRRSYEGLRRVELALEPMHAVLPAAHPLADRSAVALRELAGEAWMAPERDGLLVRACRAAGFEPRLVLVTRDPLAARAVAAAGLAVSLTPRLLAGIALPGIATPALRGRAPRRALYALLPGAGEHALVPALLGALREALSLAGVGPAGESGRGGGVRGGAA